MSDLNRYKKEILTVNAFVEERPDLAIHTDLTIQSAINTSATILNSICNNLISEVWNYNNPALDSNMVDDAMMVPDPSNKLYRTQFELDNIKEAFIQQTQYTINLGNDYTTGAVSGSIGNVNFSSSRNENQDKIAPAVYTLLTKARVYKLNEFMDLSNAPIDNRDDYFYDNVAPNTLETLTYATGDSRYVRQYQPSIKKKNMLLTVNPENKMTYWMDAIELDTSVPDDLVETVFNNVQRLNILEIDNEANKDLINNNTDEIMDLKTKMSDTGNVIENLINANNESRVMIQTLETSIDNNSNLIKNIEQEQNNQDLQIEANKSDIDSLKLLVNENKQDNIANSQSIETLNQNVNQINNYFQDGNLIRFRGSWNSTTNYAAYDYVLYNDKTYFALKPSVDIEPGTNPDYWKEQPINQNVDVENCYKKVDGINIEDGDTPTIEITDETTHLTKISKYGILSVDENLETEKFAITLNNRFVGVVNEDYYLGGELAKDCAFIAPWEDALTHRITPTLLFMPSNENPLRFTTMTNGRIAFNDINVFKPKYGVIEGLAHFEELVAGTDYNGEPGRLAVNKKYVDEVKQNTTAKLQEQNEELNRINAALSEDIANLRDKIYDLESRVAAPAYYIRASYNSANITFRFCDQLGNSITAGYMEVKWNFQNGYMDNGNSFNTKKDDFKANNNTSSLTISYPARNDYYSSYEYILCCIEVHYNGVQYFTTFQNFWTPYNGRAVISGKTVCFNLPLLPKNK